MGSLVTYVIRRVLFMIPVFLAVSILTFAITNSAGNPIEIIRIGIKNLSPAQLKALQDFYHVNDPIFVRYFFWLADFVRGNLGISLSSGAPVSLLIFPWVGTTLELQFTSLFLALLIGIPVGVFSAKRQYSKSDVTVTTAAIFGVSMPTFWLGIMGIIVFSFYLHWLPASGAVSGYPPYWWGSIYTDLVAHALLPIAVLTFVSLAAVVRLVRANMLETLRQDYVLAAKASGLRERTVTYKYALKNAITPLVTIVGLSLGLSLAGAPGLETTFSWPGLGYEFATAATILDLPTVQAITMIITLLVLVFNLATDLFYAYLDPRVRLS